ncbi:F-box/FBD/LRR-repeat protein [Raphanus sativus]|nr:F-box/FBD/LRR-repeat protein [Raphanus sativus]
MRSEEDSISQLPDVLIHDILSHLSTKDAVRTSVLATRWRNLWQHVVGLDLKSRHFQNCSEFVSFTDRFFSYHKDSLISKVCLSICDNLIITPWIDLVTARGIQHLDIFFEIAYTLSLIPLSLYTCETLVRLRLAHVFLVNTEFVSLPCLKIMDLEVVRCPNEATLEKLISGSLALEDLKIFRYSVKVAKGLQVRSRTLKRIHLYTFYNVLIEAPLLQCLKTDVNLRNQFEIIHSGFLDKVDIFFYGVHHNDLGGRRLTRDILTAMSMVSDLFIRCSFWEEIIPYIFPDSKLQFCSLSRLTSQYIYLDLEMLLNLLQSCPKLESLNLLIGDASLVYRENREAKAMSSTVPPCLVSSLKFMELKSRIFVYEREMKLVKYFLENSTILEKLTISLRDDNSIKAKHVILGEILAMQRCSSTCQVLVL